MNFTSNFKIGARYRVQHLDPSGIVKGESDWGCNLIVDSALAHIRDGYTERPLPKLGSSILETSVTQNGVQAHIPTMALLSHVPLWDGMVHESGLNSVVSSWGTKFKFRNEGFSAVSVSEIGYDNLNRMVFKDEEGNVTSWSVDPNDILVIDESFSIAFSAPTSAIAISIVNQSDEVIDTVNASLTVLDLVEVQPNDWWNLLKKPAEAAYLITDTNWSGTTSPANGVRLIPSIEPVYSYNGRAISVSVAHRGRAGGDEIRGMIIQFGTLTPVFAIQFDRTITIGSGYLFEANLTANW